VSEPDPELEAFLRSTLVDHAAAAPHGDDLAATVGRAGRAQRRRRRLTGAAVALALAAVAVVVGSQLEPFADDTSAPPASARRDLGAGAQKAPPAGPTMVTCGGDERAPFDVALLTDRPPLDPGSTFARAIVDNDLDSPNIGIVHWTLARETESLAFLLGWTSTDALSMTILAKKSDGRWWRGGGPSECELLRSFGDGMDQAAWAPFGDPPGPDATTLELEVRRPICHLDGEGTAHEELADVIIEYRDDAVLISPRLEPWQEGTNPCYEGPPVPVRVDLTEPLGDRVLLDGLFYPARPPSIEP
jgi:hypothetical protein